MYVGVFEIAKAPKMPILCSKKIETENMKRASSIVVILIFSFYLLFHPAAKVLASVGDPTSGNPPAPFLVSYEGKDYKVVEASNNYFVRDADGNSVSDPTLVNKIATVIYAQEKIINNVDVNLGVIEKTREDFYGIKIGREILSTLLPAGAAVLFPPLIGNLTVNQLNSLVQDPENYLAVVGLSGLDIAEKDYNHIKSIQAGTEVLDYNSAEEVIQTYFDALKIGPPSEDLIEDLDHMTNSTLDNLNFVTEGGKSVIDSSAETVFGGVVPGALVTVGQIESFISHTNDVLGGLSTGRAYLSDLANWKSVSDSLEASLSSNPIRSLGGKSVNGLLNNANVQSANLSNNSTTSTPLSESLSASTQMSSIGSNTSSYNFTQTLTVGSSGVGVTQLQTTLINLGLLQQGLATGYFGPLTEAAVEKYQGENGISPIGIVGPLTRAQLNAQLSSPQNTTPASSAPTQSLPSPSAGSCNPEWQIGSWTSCVNGEETRTVTDLNNCGTTMNEPATNQVCQSPISIPTPTPNQSFSPGSFALTYTLTCSATPVEATLTLNWTPSAGATSYLLYENGSLVNINLGSTATTYSTTNLTAGQTYSFYLTALGSSGFINSNTVSVPVSINFCAAQAPITVCAPNWSCGPWGSCINGQQFESCVDLNHCGTVVGEPSPIRSCSIESCTPNWQTGPWSTCLNGQQTRSVTDFNGCGTTSNEPTSAQSCVSTPVCVPNWQTGPWGDCVNGEQTRSVFDNNHCGVSTNEPPVTQSCTLPPPTPGNGTFNISVNNTQFTLETPVTNTSFEASCPACTPPYTWTVTGLPPGMYNDGATIEGAPTEAGTFNSVKVIVRDSYGIMAVRTFTFDVACRITSSGPNCVTQ